MLGSSLSRWWSSQGLASKDDSRRVQALERLARDGSAKSKALLSESLADESPKVRECAVRALAKSRSSNAVPLLCDALIQEHVLTVIRAATEALSQFDRKVVLPRLRQSLEHPDVQPQQTAASVLLRLYGDTLDDALRTKIHLVLGDWASIASCGTASVPRLREVLLHGTDRAKRAAADALAQIGSGAMETLLEVLRDTKIDPVSRSMAAWALRFYRLEKLTAIDMARAAIRVGEWKAVEELGLDAVEPLLEAVADQDSDIRVHAVDCLADIGGEAAEQTLEQAFGTNHNQMMVRERIVTRLSTSGSELAQRVLVAALSDSVWQIRKIAAAGLRASLWRPNHSADHVRFAIARKEWDELIRIGDKAIPHLVEALSLPAINTQAVQTIVWIGDSGKQALLDVQRNPEVPSAIRELVSTALVDSGDQRVIEPLVEMLKDEDIVIRQSAVMNLERLGFKPENDHDRALFAIMHDDWEEVRRLGIMAIGQILEHLTQGYADPACVSTMEAILSEGSAKLPIKRLQQVAEISDFEVLVDGRDIIQADCSKIRQLAKYELIRRGVTVPEKALSKSGT